jgi:hypothetical protein
MVRIILPRSPLVRNWLKRLERAADEELITFELQDGTVMAAFVDEDAVMRGEAAGGSCVGPLPTG